MDKGPPEFSNPEFREFFLASLRRKESTAADVRQLTDHEQHEIGGLGMILHFVAAHFPAFMSWAMDEFKGSTSDIPREAHGALARVELCRIHNWFSPDCVPLEFAELPEAGTDG